VGDCRNDVESSPRDRQADSRSAQRLFRRVCAAGGHSVKDSDLRRSRSTRHSADDRATLERRTMHVVRLINYLDIELRLSAVPQCPGLRYDCYCRLTTSSLFRLPSISLLLTFRFCPLSYCCLTRFVLSFPYYTSVVLTLLR